MFSLKSGEPLLKFIKVYFFTKRSGIAAGVFYHVHRGLQFNIGLKAEDKN